MTITRSVAVLSIALFACTAAIAARQDGDGTRQIVLDAFVAARPAAATPATRPRPRYRVARPAAAAAAPGPVAELGVTVWRLVRPKEPPADTRLLVQEPGDTSVWLPERVDPGSSLVLGDRVRLGMESPRAGYLYVIDREEYADGTRGPAYLIFPTRRTRGGENGMVAGRVIEIPGRGDNPNYFTVRRSRPDQVAEVLSAIVSAQPLTELPLSDRAAQIDAADIARFDAEWSVPAEELTAEDQAGRPWSASEAQAGVDPTRLLTQDDPPPQTVYRVRPRPGKPLFVSIRLPYGAGSQDR